MAVAAPIVNLPGPFGFMIKVLATEVFMLPFITVVLVSSFGPLITTKSFKEGKLIPCSAAAFSTLSLYSTYSSLLICPGVTVAVNFICAKANTLPSSNTIDKNIFLDVSITRLQKYTLQCFFKKLSIVKYC